LLALFLIQLPQLNATASASQAGDDCKKVGQTSRKGKNVYICDACKTSDTHKVQLPYAFKLMMQELMSVNILPRIRVEENEFNNSV
jgi:DNA-directed RNA polymerase beta subunit